MRIAIIGPPFIAIPPARYGGTELFIANLARGLHAQGHDVTVYTNGDSRLPCRVKWRYPHGEWPQVEPMRAQLENADHTAWAISDAASYADVIHLNDIVGVPCSWFVDVPIVVTLHHPHEPVLSAQYARYPQLTYVAIAEWLARRETMPRLSVVHHGITISDYTFSAEKDDYVVFLGRMAPCKGAHLAIEVARRAGVRLKLVGEIQPLFHDYWQDEVLPGIDGRDVRYVGEAGLLKKNNLLSRARALLFPIQWEEPFGLVMVEAMACGTPVLALPGGAVAEVVRDGVSGWICRDLDDMVARLGQPLPAPAACRDYVSRRFSLDRMVEGYVAVYEQAIAGENAAAAADHALEA